MVYGGWCDAGRDQQAYTVSYSTVSAPTTFIHVPGAALDRVEIVGNYALGMFWTDGHDTGIYSFHRLRDMCPCRVCKPAGLEDALPLKHGCR